MAGAQPDTAHSAREALTDSHSLVQLHSTKPTPDASGTVRPARQLPQPSTV